MQCYNKSLINTSSSSLTSKRQFLTGLSSFLILSPVTLTYANQDKEKEQRHLHVYHVETGEAENIVYFEKNNYIESSLERLDWLFRDYNIDKSLVMDVRLYDVLSKFQSKFQLKKPIHLTSGYRSKQTNESLRKRSSLAAKNSLHIYGMAADFYIPGVSVKSLREFANKERFGGVGTYKGARFIHIDVGAVRQWRR